MNGRLRAWLVGLIADGIVEANRRQALHVHIEGTQVVRELRKLQHRNGRGGMAV